MEPDSQLRNLRDFLMVYNRMTEICFQRCSSNFNYRNLTMDEERCVDNCAGKLIRSNHRLMGTYVQLMPGMVQRRVEEMENKAKKAENLAEAAAGALEGAAAGVPATPEGSPLAEATLISSPASSMTEAPPMISSANTGLSDVSLFLAPTTTGLAADIPVVSSPAPVLGEAMVASEVPVLKPAGLDLSAELYPATSISIAALPPAQEGNIAAATPLTPATAVIPSSLSQAVNGLALTAVVPLELPPIIRETSTTGLATPISVPTMSGNSVPVTSLPPTFTPVTPRTPLEVTPAPTIPAPTLSKVTQSPAVAVAPVVPPVSTPVVMPSPSQPEVVKPLSAPVLAPPVENLDLPKTVNITAPTSNNDVSFTPSIPPSTVTEQDSQPPS